MYSTALEMIPEEDRGGTPLCERALVGALLIDGGLRRRVADLSPEQFRDATLGAVFELVQGIDGPVDLVIAVDEAERCGLARSFPKGVAVYLAGLLDLVPDVENVDGYAARIRRASIARQVEEMRRRKMMGGERG